MKKFISFTFFVLLVVIIFDACQKDSTEPEIPIVPPPVNDPVSVNLDSVPYTNLAQYRFFTGDIKNNTPNDGVIQYQPASALFTDYARKKRFVWLPAGMKGTYVADDQVIDFPVGTALIKTFYYDNVQPDNVTKLIETRVMIRKSSEWIFADYIWNEDQTEATLYLNGSFVNLTWDEEGSSKSTVYRIPSGTECLICHKSNNLPIPIGIKPQNLNNDFTYPSGRVNQLQHFISKGILENNLPPNIVSTIDYHDTTQSLKLRLRSYLDINCGHCHHENSHCDYRPIRLAFSETTDPVHLGQCVTPDDQFDPTLSEIIFPGNYNKSMMYFRLNSTDQNNRMPLLGRTIVDEAAVKLLRDYISSISNCTD